MSLDVDLAVPTLHYIGTTPVLEQILLCLLHRYHMYTRTVPSVVAGISHDSY